MDRLIEAIEDKQNPSVVGLDPTEALVPKQVVASFAEEIAEQVEDPTEAPAAQLSVAFFEFNRAIIDAVADIVPAVKPQIAMYEALGPAGIDAYSMTCEYAKQQGLYVLGDVKRGDIGSTAAAYAHHLSGVNAGERAFDPWHEDAVTVNPYLAPTASPRSSKPPLVPTRTSSYWYAPPIHPAANCRNSNSPQASACTSISPASWKAGEPKPSARTGIPVSARWSEPPIPRKARRCGRACRTRSSWSPVTRAGRYRPRRGRHVRQRRHGRAR